jgi:hypothetical protein
MPSKYFTPPERVNSAMIQGVIDSSESIIPLLVGTQMGIGPNGGFVHVNNLASHPIASVGVLQNTAAPGDPAFVQAAGITQIPQVSIADGHYCGDDNNTGKLTDLGLTPVGVSSVGIMTGSAGGSSFILVSPILFASAGGGGAVSSVFGRVGAVIAAIGDYAFSQISGLLATDQVATPVGTGAGLQTSAWTSGSPGELAIFSGNGTLGSGGETLSALLATIGDPIQNGSSSGTAATIFDAAGDAISLSAGNVSIADVAGDSLDLTGGSASLAGTTNTQLGSPGTSVIMLCPVNTFSTTVADLPAGVEGQWLYASNGLKVGEITGSGTGVPVYFSNGLWRVFSTDQQVQS